MGTMNVNPANMNAGQALELYHGMTEQLDHAIYGERYAKDVGIAGIVMQKLVLFTGLPGGGKSTLSESLPYLLNDVDRADVALIPGQHDLTANQLVGGEIGSEKQVETGGVMRTEKTLTVIEGMVKPTTKFIRAEEFNRSSPLAVQALLPVVESKRLEIAGRIVEIPNLAGMVATMNATESRQSTFTISDAMASRIVAGAVMGVKGGRQERLEHIARVRKFRGGPEQVEPVVDTASLSALRAYVLRTQIDDTTEAKLDELAVDTADVLKEEYEVHETDNRIGKQIALNAKVFGGLRSREHVVRDEDLHDAVRSVVVARLGALRRTNGFDVENIVHSITKF